MVTIDPVLAAEAAWLNADPTIAGILAPAGVLPYVREPPPAGARVCWLFRTGIDESRDVTGPRKRLTHRLQLRIKWPLETAGANVVDLQAAADTLVTALLTRIRDVGGNKTHGGAFSWVAEAVAGVGQSGVQVAYMDAEQCLRQNIPWQADLTYTAVQNVIAG
jgi:hypothetical protein